MEKALCSLEDAIRAERIRELDIDASEIPHHFSLDIASGLRSVHDSNLVHGDLKPTNILIFRQENGRVPYIAKLSDFGSCIALDDPWLSYSSYRGTEGWRPPEVSSLDGSFLDSHLQQVDPKRLVKCDSYVYGLVIVALFLSCGDPAKNTRFQVPGAAVSHSITTLSTLDLPPQLHQTLQRVAKSLLDRTPELRPDVHPDLLLCDVDSCQAW
jgi:serine/threonine protein kinase